MDRWMVSRNTVVHLFLSINPSIHASIYPSILSIYLFINLSIHQSIYPSISLGLLDGHRVEGVGLGTLRRDLVLLELHRL